MSVAHLLTVLENDEFIERIQKRPEAFIGTTGFCIYLFYKPSQNK